MEMIYLPIYEYECSNQHSVIVSVAINDEHISPIKCQTCGESLIRKFGSLGIKFNGSGWGKDDK